MLSSVCGGILNELAINDVILRVGLHLVTWVSVTVDGLPNGHGVRVVGLQRPTEVLLRALVVFDSCLSLLVRNKFQVGWCYLVGYSLPPTSTQ